MKTVSCFVNLEPVRQLIRYLHRIVGFVVGRLKRDGVVLKFESIINQLEFWRTHFTIPLEPKKID